jgi:hypothetical protein
MLRALSRLEFSAGRTQRLCCRLERKVDLLRGDIEMSHGADDPRAHHTHPDSARKKRRHQLGGVHGPSEFGGLKPI